jgi:sulfate adenylyltransferase subunit 1 (EFTu-like GTPase family)
LPVDLDTNRSAVAGSLAANDIGAELDRLIAADRYLDRRDTGSFILIDPETGDDRSERLSQNQETHSQFCP